MVTYSVKALKNVSQSPKPPPLLPEWAAEAGVGLPQTASRYRWRIRASFLCVGTVKTRMGQPSHVTSDVYLVGGSGLSSVVVGYLLLCRPP